MRIGTVPTDMVPQKCYDDGVKSKVKNNFIKNSYIHIHLVGDKEIKRLNNESFGKNYPTDVLSFNIDEKLPDGQNYIGDVVVNIDQAKRQMKEFGNDDVRKEIAELVEHGILHLLGIHHEKS